MTRHTLAAGLALAGLAISGAALAVLPPPSPAQAQAAAAKKAQADAQAQKDKAELMATMDALTARWRSRAQSQGWPVHPPVAVAAATPAAPGAPAATAAVSAPLTGAAPAGQPGGQQGPAVANAPIRSEKLGTAPPSTDVKATPTLALPKGAAPTVDKHKK
jgi:colicin import membrane protein